MARTVAIGIQQFSEVIEKKCFYVDKTNFIKEWWESMDSVTLITRPRRFGKTLNMSMVEQFFSVDYANRGDLFEGLSIWEEETYRNIHGTYPVISLSFARVKEVNYADTREKICEILRKLYIKYSFLKESAVLTEADKAFLTEFCRLKSAIQMRLLRFISYLIFCTAIMAKRLLSSWMSMIRSCRKPMWMDTGRSLWHLPEACSTPRSKQIHGWNVGL